ncbi:MAG: hypothetical protein AAFR59_17250, partial [Bacteroidota bacterium]
FVKYFGGRVKQLETKEAAQAAYDAFVEKPFTYKGEEVTYITLIERSVYGSHNTDIAGPILFFIPGKGISSLNGLEPIETKLATTTYDHIEDRKTIFANLFWRPFPVVVLRHLIEQYPEAPWYLAVPGAETRIDEWQEAFFRFFHSEQFAQN